MLIQDHRDIDRRSLDMHKLVAQKIRLQPELFDRVKSLIERRLASIGPNERPYWMAWRVLTEQDMEAALRVAEDASVRSAAMRQASPFSGILSHKERFVFLKNWRP